MGDDESVPRRRIWWLAGYPKSGSTWVRMFLNAYVTGFPPDINSAFQYVQGDLLVGQMQGAAMVPLDRLGELDAVYYRPAALMNTLQMAPSRDVCLKTHHARIRVEGIPLMPAWLSKGAVYLVRDPRDVAPSLMRHCGHESLDETIEMMAGNDQILGRDEYDAIFHHIMSWSMHVDSWTSLNQSIPTEVVRYEDLRARPAETFLRLLRAFGFDPVNQERLRFAIEETRLEKLRALETREGFRECKKAGRFFGDGRVGGWREALTPEQARRIVDRHYETMERLGYVAAREPAAVPA